MNPDKHLPFLLLRGLTREQRHWGAFTAHLQAQFPDTPLVTPDIPGNGARYQETTPCSIAAICETLRHDFYTRGYQTPIRLIGLSMGGMIALHWMTCYPEEIHSAVVINTSLAAISPFYQRLRWHNYRHILRWLFLSDAEREQAILMMTSNQHANDQAILQQWQAWQQQSPVSAGNTLRQLLASARFKAPPKPLQALLLVTAQQDRLVDYRCSLTLQQHWQCEMALHPEAGHDLPLDAPQWLSVTIKDWQNGIY